MTNGQTDSKDSVETPLAEVRCSFCDRADEDADAFVSSKEGLTPRVLICYHCILQSAEVMIEQARLIKGELLAALPLLELAKAMVNRGKP